jgi:hypothetical protein
MQAYRNRRFQTGALVSGARPDRDASDALATVLCRFEML